MRAMQELYDVPDLKLKLKFEVEVLCKHLNIKVEDIKPSTYLQNRRKPTMRDNPDFNAKAVDDYCGWSSPAKVANETKKENNPATPALNDSNKPAIPNLSRYINVTISIPELSGKVDLNSIVTLALDRAIETLYSL